MKDPKPSNYVNPDMPFAVMANIHSTFFRPSEVDQLVTEIRNSERKHIERKGKKP
jgi:hypothetical protein